MPSKQWYETLFENNSKTYDKESFTQGTAGESDFIEQELNYSKSLKILDVGCGTGRHSIELTKRGYSVTGIDFSKTQLASAREKATKENFKIDFQKHDIRNLWRKTRAFSRNDKLTTDDFEVLVIAEK